MDRYLQEIKNSINIELSKEKYNSLNPEQKQQLGNEILKNTYEIVDRLITESLNKDLLAEYESMLKSNTDVETIKNFFIQKLPNFQSNLMTKVSTYLDTIKI